MRRNSLSQTLYLYLLAASAFAVGFGAGKKRTPVRRRIADAGDPGGDHAFGEPKSTDEPLALQKLRAAEPGRGRDARAPTEIPARGWKDILWRVYAEVQQDRLTAVAAGVVFFALLATFPATGALVSSYGLFADRASIVEHMALIAGIMPEMAFAIIRETVDRLVSTPSEQLSAGFVFGLLFALWSANAGMKAIFDALNVIYDEEEKRSFIKLNLISLTFTLGAIMAFLVAAGMVVAMPLVFKFFGLETLWQSALPLLRWPALFLLSILGLAVLYRFGPSRRDPKWRWVTVGSVVATLLWLASSAAFSWYLANFADYSAAYGSLGAAIGLMMWMWLSTLSILFGAELNAEIEHQTAKDSTVGEPKPLGARGAAMADTVGAAAS